MDAKSMTLRNYRTSRALDAPEYRLQAWDLCGPNKVIRRKDRRSFLIADFREEGTSSVVTLDTGAAETNDITHVDWQLSGPLKFLVTRAVVREIRDESLRNPARASTDREVDIRRPLDVTFVHAPPDLALTVSQLQFHGAFVHQA